MDERDKAVFEASTSRNQGVDIYDDEEAVSAAAGLYDAEPEPPGKAVRTESADKAVKEQTGPRGGREYKVREYFSDRDDLTAEEEFPAAESGGRTERNGRPARTEQADRPERRIPAARPGQKSDEVDYSDYIHSTSVELANERKRKELETTSRSKEKDYVRDAAKNPAVRRERERSGEREVPRPDNRVPARRPAAPGRVAPGGAVQPPVRGHVRDPYNPEHSAPGGRGETSRDEAAVRDESARPVPGGEGREKPHLRSAASRRNEFFEQDAKRERDYDTGPDVLASPVVRYVIICGFILLLALLVFLIFRNQALSKQVAEARENNPELQQVKLEYEQLKVDIAARDETINQLQDTISLYQNASADNPPSGDETGEENPPFTPPETGTQGNVPPTVPPTPPAITQYTVKAGDNLQKIARELLGDANRWEEIRVLNNKPNANINIGEVLDIPPR
ncbi:MAG: LysM peptidoglycan-binding domain-containing protein [Clostridiales bacterium]|jgi:nucleoid-associated protein YgaU|nr:LysM peptidoglycan-binding domain-containing protein [Clostridiales bacterium]